MHEFLVGFAGVLIGHWYTPLIAVLIACWTAALASCVTGANDMDVDDWANGLVVECVSQSPPWDEENGG